MVLLRLSPTSAGVSFSTWTTSTVTAEKTRPRSADSLEPLDVEAAHGIHRSTPCSWRPRRNVDLGMTKQLCAFRVSADHLVSLIAKGSCTGVDPHAQTLTVSAMKARQRQQRLDTHQRSVFLAAASSSLVVAGYQWTRERLACQWQGHSSFCRLALATIWRQRSAAGRGTTITLGYPS